MKNLIAEDSSLPPHLSDHVAKYPECYASKVLSPEKHYRLVSELEHIASDANIPKHLIYSKAADFCNTDELQWVRDYPSLPMGSDGGICYVGGCGDIGVRMFAMAGVLLRNFIRARVFTVQEVLAAEKSNNPIIATALLIPNFYYTSKSGGKIPDWQVSMLLGLLYSRYANSCKTIIYVEDLNRLKADYGEPFYSHITTHFKIIKG